MSIFKVKSCHGSQLECRQDAKNAIQRKTSDMSVEPSDNNGQQSSTPLEGSWRGAEPLNPVAPEAFAAPAYAPQTHQPYLPGDYAGQPFYAPPQPQYMPSPAMYPHQQRNGSHTSLILGIIALSFTIMLGWIPLIGILGVGIGIGLGIPAIIQGGKEGVNGTIGRVLGWVAIGFSALFITFYMVAFAGGMSSSNVGPAQPSSHTSATKSV